MPTEMTKSTKRKSKSMPSVKLFEGLPVHAWVDTARAAWEGGVDERTLYNNRGMGLPALRARDGTWWYPLPHLHIWRSILRFRLAQGRKVEFLTFAIALAHHRLLEAEEESRAGYLPPARRGRYSYRDDD